MNNIYDYLIVGARFYGTVFAREVTEVIDKRPNIAGNAYTEDVEGIHVNKFKYRAHIFHTNNKQL